MDVEWTLAELVAQAASHIAALPAPANGQVRAVPDDRTVRYYGTIGLLDRPQAMRGRTALYGKKHLAQIVAIKRLQTAGRSLAEIQELWGTLDDASLSRMAGVEVKSRKDFWKQPASRALPAKPVAHAAQPVELRIELAPGISLTVAVAGDVALSTADVRALRAATAPLVTELARRGLAAQNQEDT